MRLRRRKERRAMACPEGKSRCLCRRCAIYEVRKASFAVTAASVINHPQSKLCGIALSLRTELENEASFAELDRVRTLLNNPASRGSINIYVNGNRSLLAGARRLILP